MPGVPLRTLAQFIDIAFLREAYRRTRKDGAVGVDRQTAEDYAADLEGNLQRLLSHICTECDRHPEQHRDALPVPLGVSPTAKGVMPLPPPRRSGESLQVLGIRSSHGRRRYV